MSSEDQLAKKIDTYQSLAKQNPNIDVGMLMLNALQNEKKNSVSGKSKKWAYLISISVPPFGLLLALKYFFDDKDDAKDVAWTCVVLTIISIFAVWLGAKLLVSGSGTSVDQISKIKLQDIQQLGQ